MKANYKNWMPKGMMGYQKVELIDTTDGQFMTPFEARWMALSGSALLVGIK